MLFGLDTGPIVVEESVYVAGMIPCITCVVRHRPDIFGIMVYLIEGSQATQQDHVEPRAGGVEAGFRTIYGFAHFGKTLVGASGGFLCVFQIGLVA